MKAASSRRWQLKGNNNASTLALRREGERGRFWRMLTTYTICMRMWRNVHPVQESYSRIPDATYKNFDTSKLLGFTGEEKLCRRFRYKAIHVLTRSYNKVLSQARQSWVKLLQRGKGRHFMRLRNQGCQVFIRGFAYPLSLSVHTFFHVKEKVRGGSTTGDKTCGDQAQFCVNDKDGTCEPETGLKCPKGHPKPSIEF